MAEIAAIKFRILLLVVAAFALTISHGTEVAKHEVDWIIPLDVSSFYTNFSANTAFTLNDTLVFKFKTGAHNVVTLSKENFERCIVSETLESFNTGPATITLNRTGEFYFACAFPQHCNLGQKLSINVTTQATTSLAPTPPSGSPPSGSPAPAALSLSATHSILLLAVVITVLF